MVREYINREDMLNTGREKLNRSIDKSYDAEETSVQALKDANKLGNEAKQISIEKGNESIALAKENEKVAGEANLIAKDTNERMNQIISGTTDSAEIIDARKPIEKEPFPTLGARLANNDEILKQKIYKFSSITELKNSSIETEAIVHTTGFYEENDGGAAKYYLTSDEITVDNMSVHLLKNGLKAVLIIENETLDIRQLGAKADFMSIKTDNYNFIEKALEKASIILLGNINRYFVSKRIHLKSNVEIIGNGSYIYSKQGILIDADSNRKIRLSKLKVVNPEGDMTGMGIELRNSDKYLWGAHVDISDVNISGFRINFTGDALFANSLKNTISSNTKIGYHFTGKNHLSNENENHRISCLNTMYGVVLENTRNTKFNLCTFENVETAIVSDKDSIDITFDTCWFENIEKTSVVYGKLNIEKLTVTEENQTNQFIKFVNTRFYNDGFKNEFFSSSSKFNSQYGNFNETLMYSDNVDSLFLSGLIYQNLAQQDIAIGGNATGSVSKQYSMTPFGNKLVTKGSGLSGGFYCTIPIKKTHILKNNNLFLLKIKIKTSQSVAVNIYPDDNIFDEPTNIVKENSPGMVSVKDGWIEIPKIVRMVDNADSFGGAAIVVRLYGFEGKIDIEVTDPIVVNLTTIFGMGYEPDLSFHKKIAKYFGYVPHESVGVTGSSFNLEIGGPETTRPSRNALRPYQSYFDTTLNKPIWYNGSEWVDATGKVVT